LFTTTTISESEWEPRELPDGRTLYIDHANHKTSWINPSDTQHKSTLRDLEEGELPLGWERVKDPHYGDYFIDHNTQSTYSVPPWIFNNPDKMDDNARKLEALLGTIEDIAAIAHHVASSYIAAAAEEHSELENENLFDAQEIHDIALRIVLFKQKFAEFREQVANMKAEILKAGSREELDAATSKWRLLCQSAQIVIYDLCDKNESQLAKVQKLVKTTETLRDLNKIEDLIESLLSLLSQEEKIVVASQNVLGQIQIELNLLVQEQRASFVPIMSEMTEELAELRRKLSSKELEALPEWVSVLSNKDQLLAAGAEEEEAEVPAQLENANEKRKVSTSTS